MKQFDLQGNEYDCTIEIPLKKATYEDIQALNIHLQTQLYVKDKEIERLNKELDKTRLSELDKEYKLNKVREYITSQKLHKFQDTTGELTYQERKLLEIIDYLEENKND